jgi:hypothetical protein
MPAAVTKVRDAKSGSEEFDLFADQRFGEQLE